MSTELALFKPTKRQNEAKARLIQSLQGSWKEPGNLTLSELKKLSGSTTVEKWLKDPEFKSWFLERDTVEVKLKANVEAGVEELVRIVGQSIDGEVYKVSDKLKAIELLFKYSGMDPKAARNKDEDDGVVDPEDLDEFVADQARQYIKKLSPEERVELLGVGHVQNKAD